MSLCWTVDSVKDHLGIEDAPDVDKKIEAAMSVTVAAIERYCNRKFEHRQDFKELAYRANGNGWQVHLWPITSKVYVEGDPVDFTIDNEAGVIWFEQYKHTETVELQFSGGYQECDWPADLYTVLLGSIKNAWDMVSGEVVNTSAISRVTIPDVGTVSFDNSSSGSINHGGILIGGIVPSSWQSTLDFYRLHEC